MITKQSVIWNRVTEKLPEQGRDYLVWTGSRMIVSDAHFYDIEKSRQLVSEGIVDKKWLQDIINSKGKFEEFGSKYYFDDPDIYWSELPLAPGEKNPPLPDPFEGMVGKDVYLKKDGHIIGLHAIGDINPETGEFMQMEIWGNEYDDEHNMLGRGSFRVFDNLENEAKNWEADGWVRFEGPKKKT